LLLAFGACFLYMAFRYGIFYRSRLPSSMANRVALAAELLVIAAVGIVLGLREIRSGLWIDSERVIVRGLFRTSTMTPDEVDGFKPEMRLAPCPLLHLKHGSPVIVGALAHGGFLKSTQDQRLKELEPICDQLTALLHTVQSAHARKDPSALIATTHKERRAEYPVLRGVFIAFACVVVLICGGIAALVRTPTAIAVMGGIAVVQSVGTFIVLALVRKDLDRANLPERAHLPPSSSSDELT
jgi:hypothetical protein